MLNSTTDGLKSARTQQRLLLWCGLGGLVVLLVALGLSAVTFMRRIEERHERIRAEFVARLRLLEELRNDVYRSGTRVHDFLLEPDARTASVSRNDVLASHDRIEALEAEYARTLRPDERALFDSLRHEIDVYLAAVVPVLDWTPDQRIRDVDVFVRDDLHPRRAVMLRIADEIETLNAQEMDQNSSDAAGLFLSYRRLLLLLVGLTLAVGSGLAVFSGRRMWRLEREADARFRQVEHAKAELQALSAKLVDAQESERRKLARELHDEVGQGLWAMVLGIGNATAALTAEQVAEARQHLATTQQLADGMVQKVRNLSLILRPSILDDLGLMPALKWLAREVSRTSGLRVDMSSSGMDGGLDEERRTCIYRVVQEALHNCQRHAAATIAQVRIDRQHGGLRLTIHDDGGGFRPAQERGLGVLGMEERVTHLGGRFTVASEPGAGTAIEVWLPLPQPAS